MRAVALLLIVLVPALPACSLVGPKEQMLRFDSTPEGVDIFVNGMHIGKTPTAYGVGRGEDVSIKASKPGYRECFRSTSRGLSTLGIVDIIGGACFLLPFLGLLSPAAWEHDPETFRFNLSLDDGATAAVAAAEEGSSFADVDLCEALDLDDALDSLSKQIIDSMGVEGKKKVAILDFASIRHEESVFGQFLSEELISRLFLTGKFKVIERRFVENVLAEQKLSLSDMFDQDSAVEIGRLLGVDAVATGTFSDLGAEIRVNGRLISTESGEVFAVAKTRIVKDSRLKSIIDRD